MSKKQYLIAGLLIAVVATVLLIARSNKNSNKQPVVVPNEQTFEIQGRDHIEIGQSHAPYNSNPPTSGPHYAQPADWGIYDKELPDEQLVHNLEHGGIWISYKDIDPKTLDDLKDIARYYPGSVILTPRAANDSKIVVASWGKLMKLSEYDRAAIIAFINRNKNKSPEPIVQ